MKALNQISNLIILTLVNYARDYPWASYIANSTFTIRFDIARTNAIES